MQNNLTGYFPLSFEQKQDHSFPVVILQNNHREVMILFLILP